MMPQTAGDDPAAGTGCEERLARLDAVIDRFEAATADLEEGLASPDISPRLTRATAVGRELRAEVDGLREAHALTQDFLRAFEARIERRVRAEERAARAPGQRKGRHASASLPQRALRIVTGIAGTLGLTGVLRHLLAASPAVKGAVAVSLTAVTLTAGAVAVIPGASIPLPFGASPAGTPAPAASIEAAVPVVPPSSVRLIRAMSSPGAKPRLEAKASGATVPDVPPSCYCAPPAEGPAPSSPSPQPSQPSAQVQATLEPIATSLDLTVALSVTVTLTAQGNTGWVSWSVKTSGTDLDFSKMSGVLTPGQSYPLVVTVDPAQAVDGDTSATFSIDDQEVSVALPALPAVVPSVSATPSAPPSGSD